MMRTKPAHRTGENFMLLCNKNAAAFMKTEHPRSISIGFVPIPDFWFINFLGKMLPNNRRRFHAYAYVHLVVGKGDSNFLAPSMLCRHHYRKRGRKIQQRKTYIFLKNGKNVRIILDEIPK